MYGAVSSARVADICRYNGTCGSNNRTVASSVHSHAEDACLLLAYSKS